MKKAKRRGRERLLWWSKWVLLFLRHRDKTLYPMIHVIYILFSTIRCVSNHMCYSSATCRGNTQVNEMQSLTVFFQLSFILLLFVKHFVTFWIVLNKYSYFVIQEMKRQWRSILHHALDVHSWTDGGVQHHCLHAPLSEEARKAKKWLEAGSPAYEDLRLKTSVLWRTLNTWASSNIQASNFILHQSLFF